MTAADLLAASQQELGLYQELWAVYARLVDRLTDPCSDAAGIGDDGQQAAAVSRALADLATTLAPHRLSPATLHEDVTAVWRESARLAAASAEANRRLRAAAHTRHQMVAARLGRIDADAAGAARYRQARM